MEEKSSLLIAILTDSQKAIIVIHKKSNEAYQEYVEFISPIAYGLPQRS